jgi:hypothetical protein
MTNIFVIIAIRMVTLKIDATKRRDRERESKIVHHSNSMVETALHIYETSLLTIEIE